MGLIAFVLLSLTGGFVHAGRSQALTHYSAARKHVDKQRYEKALAELDRAVAEQPRSEQSREGQFPVSYFPYYQYGRVYLAQGLPQRALEYFEKEKHEGVIQHNAPLYAELLRLIDGIDPTDPRVEVTHVGFVESRFSDRDGAIVEEADFLIRGTVIENVALVSVTVNGSQVHYRRDNGADRYSFETQVTMDPARPIRVVAIDGAGREGTALEPTGLAPLELGAQAAGIHALVVGVDTYDRAYMADDGVQCAPELRASCGDSRFQCHPLADLQAAARDARRFARFLQVRGVPEDNITLLVSDDRRRDATLQNVNAALERLAGVAGDKALFYFSGHGVSSSSRKNLMLLSDTQGFECLGSGQDNALELTSLGVADVEGALMRSAVNERYILLDACRDSRVLTRGAEAVPPASPGFSSRGLGISTAKAPGPAVGRAPVVYYATLEEKQSIEWRSKGAGYFTWFLVQALRQDLSLDEVNDWVQLRVGEQTARDLCHDQEQSSACELRQLPYLHLPKDLEQQIDLRAKTYILRSEPN